MSIWQEWRKTKPRHRNTLIHTLAHTYTHTLGVFDDRRLAPRTSSLYPRSLRIDSVTQIQKKVGEEEGKKILYWGRRPGGKRSKLFFPSRFASWNRYTTIHTKTKKEGPLLIGGFACKRIIQMVIKVYFIWKVVEVFKIFTNVCDINVRLHFNNHL